jgi:hypothetical protein
MNATEPANYTLTTVGAVAVILIMLETAKGPLGNFYAWILSGIILAMLLINYREILPVFVSGS